MSADTSTRDSPAVRRSAAAPARPVWPIGRSATISLVSVLVFFALWEIAPALGWVNGRFVSRPSLVFAAGWSELGSAAFWIHAWVSLTEFGLGFALALAVGIPLAGLMAGSTIARQLLDPPLMALYIAPSLILLPILVIWLGIGVASKVAVVFLSAVFPIIVNTMAGMRQVDPRYRMMARAFGAGALAQFLRIQVPAALPSLLTGVRLAVGRGVLGVIVGEFYAAQAGIGFQLRVYGDSMRIDLLLVYALFVSCFGYALTEAVRLAEARVQRWSPR